MAGNYPSPDRIPPIERDELIEYSGRPNYRVRLFYGAELSLPLEMSVDGFLRQNKQTDRFYVSLDYPLGDPPSYSHYLNSGEIIGIQEEGRMDFQPRRLMLKGNP